MTRSLVAQVFATEWPRLVAILMRDLGDLDLAEECAQEAFVEAAARWDATSRPANPGAWLVTTARRKAIDRIRRTRRFADRAPLLVRDDEDTEPVLDAELGMIFGCAHPGLAQPAQVAMTLRHVAGLSTAQIAAAFLVPEATMAKRLVRAKKKVAAAGIPFSVPPPDRLAERLDAVLHVVYLLFTEGHAGSVGAELVRGDLCDEARWLALRVAQRMPDQPEAAGLVALIHLTDARRGARVDPAGGAVVLEHQDRAAWSATDIATGMTWLERVGTPATAGPFGIQAHLAAAHARAGDWASTDWPRIVALYRRLLVVVPTPVVALNAAVAIAMVEGPAVGLAHLDRLAAMDDLDGYRYFHAARADLLRRLDRDAEAAAAYRRTLALTLSDSERAYVMGRLAALGAPAGHPDTGSRGP